ncbi:hypothetical protein D3C85_1525520 [compost metagenome]
MVEDGGRHPGFLDHSVAIEHGGYLAQVDFCRPHSTTTHHNSGIGGIVGNGIEHFAGCLGLRVDLLNSGVDDFQRRDYPLGCIEHVKNRAVRALERLAKNERQLHFHPWHDETFERNVGAFVEEHVIE